MATHAPVGMIGLGLGWIWCAIVSLFWIAALALGYGGLDEGLTYFKNEWWSPIAMAAYFGSVAASWVGGIVGPIFVGPTRRRNVVLTSSLLSGAGGALLAAPLAAAVGWQVWQAEPRSPLFLELTICIGAVAGVFTGLLAGRHVSPG